MSQRGYWTLRLSLFHKVSKSLFLASDSDLDSDPFDLQSWVAGSSSEESDSGNSEF